MNMRLSTMGRPQARTAGAAALIGLAAVVALLVGAVTALGNLLVSAMLLSIMGALAIAGFPRLLFWFSIVGTLVLAGLIELYLPGLQVLRWAFAGVTGLFFFSVVIRQFWSPSTKQEPGGLLIPASALFVLVTGISLAINWHGAINAASGLKNYFQAWGLLLGLALLPRWDGLERKLFHALLAIGLLQLPFALHQFLFLVPGRVGMGNKIVAVDVVAGTFGASFTGGGNNAVLAIFVIVMATLVMALWRTGAIRGMWLWLLVPLLVPIFLNESKVSVVYLLMAYLVVFRREVLRRPGRFIALSVLLGAVAVGLVFSYAALHQSSKFKDPLDLVEQVIRQNTEAGQHYGSLELNRTSAFAHWLKEQPRYPWAKTLFGHGPGASRESVGTLDITNNLANQVYPGMGIGITAATGLLWDIGVVGLAVTLAMFGAAFLLAGRLARRHAASPLELGSFQALQAAVLILWISLFHKNSFMFQLSYQVIVCLVLGYLLYASRRLVPEGVAAAAPIAR